MGRFDPWSPAFRPATPDRVVPNACPNCRSSAIVTTAKKPDATSYWRCTACGAIWNVSRNDSRRR